MRNLVTIAWLGWALAACSVGIEDGAAGNGSDPIRGGGNAQPGAYPFYVQLVLLGHNEIIPLCGGALIDPQHVLTVAHCLDNFRGHDGSYDDARLSQDLFAILGVETRAQAQDPGAHHDVTILGIEHAFVPDSYRRIGQSEEHFHDLALLRVENQPHWYPRVGWGPKDSAAPVTYMGLGRQAEDAMTQVTNNFLAWVRRDYHVLPEYPSQLKEAQAGIVTGAACDAVRTMSDTQELDPSKFCIDVTHGSPDYGDSGSPVIQINPSTGEALLVGLLQGAYGQETALGRQATIGLATEVEAYRNWINWTLAESYQAP